MPTPAKKRKDGSKKTPKPKKQQMGGSLVPYDPLSKFLPPEQTGTQGGRPSIITLEIIKAFRYAFQRGFTIAEACAHAGITKPTFYNWQDSLEPEIKAELLDQIEAWKAQLTIKAREALYSDINDPDTAKWLLERKFKKEFSKRTEAEVKNVDEFESFSDEELRKIANADINPDQTPA